MNINEPQSPEQDLNKLLRPLCHEDVWRPDLFLKPEAAYKSTKIVLVDFVSPITEENKPMTVVITKNSSCYLRGHQFGAN